MVDITAKKAVWHKTYSNYMIPALYSDFFINSELIIDTINNEIM